MLHHTVLDTVDATWLTLRGFDSPGNSQFTFSRVYLSAMNKSNCLIVALLLILLQNLVLAEEHHAEEHHKNEVGLFVGLTHERRENGLAIGAEYERRFSKSFGVGVFAERTWGDLDFWVVGLPLAYHYDRWTFHIGPGVEFGEDDSESLVRTGVAYEFDIGKYALLPAFHVDFVDGEQVFILGVVIGTGF